MNDSLVNLHEEMRACRRCLDAGHHITPGAVFRGSPGAKVLLIGQAPGVTEVEAKRPFNAGSGTRLFQWLGQAGWDETAFRETEYMTAVTKCYPGKDKSGRGDRVPSKAEQALCRPFLEREIALVNPLLMILVGGLAIKLLYPAKMKLNEVVGTAVYFPPDTLTNLVNFNYADSQLLTPTSLQSLISSLPTSHQQPDASYQYGRFIVPLPHPSGASLWPNKPANQRLIAQAVQILDTIRTTFN
ncbi:MAG: uracil-DNA glycosylase family protein [Ardenticatenaceae bacterium]|nr:uracil-DNA glycosylase family protein [Ardenticatenaceae bacterium]MCB9443514.1 uracil-DNA glycosylase family protein [Ardenticatenaceae bacterium]